MSCAVIRSVSPDLRTLPSSTASTPSFPPISWTVIRFPFRANTEVRAGTFSPLTLASALISSSVIPSLKYSFSGSSLMLTKGRMAMEAGVDGVPPRPAIPLRPRLHSRKPAAIAARATTPAAA